MTRKEKRAQQKREEKRRVDRERMNKFAVTRTKTGVNLPTIGVKGNVDYNNQGNVTKTTPGEYGVGSIKSEASKSGLSLAGDTDKYADGSEFEKSKDSSGKQSKLSKRVANRQAAKAFRKNKRAEKVGIRRGMSPEQAKDFMQNRRTRFNQAVGEFGRALGSGGQMDWGKLDKRLYRKNPEGSKGPGTLQAVSDGKGGTYDATAPYKGDPAQNYSSRGKGRKLVDKYEEILGSKVNIPVVSAKPLDLSPISTQNPKEEIDKTIEDTTDKVISPIPVVDKGDESITPGNVSPPLDEGTSESIRARNLRKNELEKTEKETDGGRRFRQQQPSTLSVVDYLDHLRRSALEGTIGGDKRKKNNSSKDSPIDKVEEDSNPSSFMKKQFFKKMGY